MQRLRMNYAGAEWQVLKEWLAAQKVSKVQRLLQPDTDQREVEMIRGALQMIDMVLNQERTAALNPRD